MSGSHVAMAAKVLDGFREAGLSLPLVVGGIIPPADAAALAEAGVAAVYTPKDFDILQVIGDLVELIGQRVVEEAAV